MRRFYALHGMAVGQVVGWQPEGAAEVAPAPNPNPDPSPNPSPNPIPNPNPRPNPKPTPSPNQDEPALWRIAMADGDLEDLEEAELTDALQASPGPSPCPSPSPSPIPDPNPNPNPNPDPNPKPKPKPKPNPSQAAQEERDVAQEVEAILEAAWEALEMAVALHAQTPGHALHPIPDPDPIPIPNPNPSPSPTPNPNPSPGLRSRAAALRGARAAGRRGDAERAARARQG